MGRRSSKQGPSLRRNHGIFHALRLLLVLLAEQEGLLVRAIQSVSLLLLLRRLESRAQRFVAAERGLETVERGGRALLKDHVEREVDEAPLEHVVAVGGQKQRLVEL
jgi:hypothetical protein